MQHDTIKPYGERKTIVLDLDHTLLHTLADLPPVDYFHPREYKLRIPYKDNDGSRDERYFGIYRPHLDTFLDAVDQHYDDIIIWSAGTKRYVEALTFTIFRFREKKPIFVLSRNSCCLLQYGKIEEGEPLTEIMIKPLQLLCSSYGYDINNVAIVDDTSTTFYLNRPQAIHIEGYNVMKDDQLVDNDDCLLKLAKYIKSGAVGKFVGKGKLVSSRQDNSLQ